MADLKQVDLLLIGKTGTGKSSTGNSILRRKSFDSKPSATSVTSDVQADESKFNDRIIKVVDGPGYKDNRLSKEEGIHMMLKQMECAIAINPQGYHAFLLLVKFGERFTDEDQETIDFLKKLFGEDFVKNFCILLMTCGDKFEEEYKGMKTFPQWYEEQQGQLQALIKECDKRVVLFNNKITDEEKKKKQIEDLLTVVDNLTFRERRYTNDTFARAKKGRERIMVELRRSVIQDKTMREASLILSKIEKLRKKPDFTTKVKALEILQVSVESLLGELSAQDQRPGALHDMYENVESIKKYVTDEIALCKRRIEERNKVRRQEEETRKKHEEEVKLLMQERNKVIRQEEETRKKHEEEVKLLMQERNKVIRQEEEVRNKHQEEVKLLKEQHAQKVKEVLERFQKEQERLTREMEERIKVKTQEIEKNFKPQKALLVKRFECIETRYIKVRENNDNSIIGGILGGGILGATALLMPLLALPGCVIS